MTSVLQSPPMCLTTSMFHKEGHKSNVSSYAVRTMSYEKLLIIFRAFFYDNFSFYSILLIENILLSSDSKQLAYRKILC